MPIEPNAADFFDDDDKVRRGSVDRANLLIAAIALAVAFINLVPTLYFLLSAIGLIEVAKAPTQAQLMVSFALAIIAVTVICAILFYLYLKEHRKSADLRLELGLLKKLEGITAEQKDLNIYICRVIEYLLFKRANLQVNDTEAHELFFRSLVNNVKNVFDRVTGEECAVCIKSVADIASSAESTDIGGGDDDIYVKTMCRDRASFEDRNGSNNESWYSIKLNTAFYRIISPKWRNSFFLANDLPALAAEGNYNNGSEHWHENYKATVVVPVGNSLGIKKRQVRAFLCVDSLNATFNKDQSVNILRVFSQIANQVPINYIDEHQKPPKINEAKEAKNGT